MNTFPKQAYGMLLAFDGYGADNTACTSEAFLKHLLLTLPEAIGMRRLGDPHIVYVDEPGIAGMSGFTFIMESHISIHTYEEHSFVTADIYSCKWFDTGLAARLLAQSFGISSYEINELSRGLRFDTTNRLLRSHARP